MKRFWDKVNKTDSCWLWTGCKSPKGYGVFRIIGGTIRAHRFSYLLKHGAIPDCLMVLHKCDNPACVNPDHLYLGTARENAVDMFERNPPNRRGVLSKRSKLNDDKVRAIISLSRSGLSNMELGVMFNVHNSTISKVVLRKEWNHVQL